jgi:hypothetical protein
MSCHLILHWNKEPGTCYLPALLIKKQMEVQFQKNNGSSSFKAVFLFTFSYIDLASLFSMHKNTIGCYVKGGTFTEKI